MGYRERLVVPLSWWGIGVFFAGSFVAAIGFTLGGWVSIVGGAVVAVLLGACLWWYGSLQVSVGDDGLVAAGARLEWPWLGEVTALDAAATHERLGAGADSRAFLATRGYVRTAVEVQVADAADPHPYWLVSTRHPRRLAAAIESARPGASH